MSAEGTVSFAADIKPLFREKDRQSMRMHFDLWSHEDVSDAADRILERLRRGSLVGVVDIAEMAGVNSKQRASQITHNQRFPAPAIETRAGRLWAKTAVERYLRRRGAQPTQPD